MPMVGMAAPLIFPDCFRLFHHITLLVLLLFPLHAQVSADTLKLVQIVYRHGDRSPTDPVPNDPNNAYWLDVTDGYGQLTNLGKQQQFQLGQYIRQRYSTFLNPNYSHTQILINSTDKDRTLMSAYSNLAGLYPPTGNQIWDSNIAWQPIPVHSRPLLADYVLSTDCYCPKFDNLFDIVKASPEMQQINQENADLFALASNETGLKIDDIFKLNKVTDFYYCSKCHNLTTPEWIDPVWDQMEHLHDLKFYYEFGIPPLSRLMGGALVGSMITRMQQSIDGQIPDQKAFIYSSNLTSTTESARVNALEKMPINPIWKMPARAEMSAKALAVKMRAFARADSVVEHDSKIAAFLSALQVFNNVTPPYASSVYLELYSLDAGGNGVQIWYRNSTAVEPYPITIPNCAFTCPIDQFIQLTQAMVPEDVVQECIFVSNFGEENGNHTSSPLEGLLYWFEDLFN